MEKTLEWKSRIVIKIGERDSLIKLAESRGSETELGLKVHRPSGDGGDLGLEEGVRV